MNTRLFSKAHLDGVTEFMNFVSDNLGDRQEILCPCRKCLNRVHQHKGEVETHLYIYGMTNTYTIWIHHGEALEVGLNENFETGDIIDCNIEASDRGCNVEVEMNETEDDPDDDRIHEMVHELYTAEDHGPTTKSKFATIIEEMKHELHPDGPYTRFSFVVKLLHIKSFYRISNVAFTAFLNVLSIAFPKCSIPASYAEAKKVIRALGLGYDSIHVCPNNCVLFRKKLAKMDKCPLCGASRWKDEDTRNQIPNKVLKHFPVVPRL